MIQLEKIYIRFGKEVFELLCVETNQMFEAFQQHNKAILRSTSFLS